MDIASGCGHTRPPLAFLITLLSRPLRTGLQEVRGRCSIIRSAHITDIGEAVLVGECQPERAVKPPVWGPYDTSADDTGKSGHSAALQGVDILLFANHGLP